MNKEVKKKWLVKLRSKKAKQIQGNLKTVTEDGAAAVGHCCLGILCEIHAETHLGFKWSKPNMFGECHYGSRRVTDESIPTASVLKWAGITNEEANRLANLNDKSLLSFPEIAKVISKEY